MQLVDESELSSEATVSPCSGKRPYEQMVFINNLIANNKSLGLAIIASLPVGGFSEEYIDALKKRISFLEENNTQVIVFSPVVSLGYDIKACYPRPLFEASETCEVDSEKHRLIMNDFAILQRQISYSNPKTLFYDRNAFNCIGSKCLFKIDGMPMYRDQFGHLSEYASIRLINHFSRWAKLNAPGIIQPNWYIPK